MTTRLLYLVRHAPVTLVQDRPADEWQLTGDGRDLAALLAAAPAWRGLGLIATSPEPKAAGTAEPIAAAAGLEPRREPDLREAGRGRTAIVSVDEYRQTVDAYFASLAGAAGGPDWEPAAEVQRRATACIDRLLGATDGHVAVVSHGLALSLYLAGLRGWARPDLAEWSAIALPAVAVVDPAARRLVHPFMSAEEFIGGAGRGAE